MLSPGLIGSQPCRSSTPRRSPPASLSWLQRCMVGSSFRLQTYFVTKTSRTMRVGWPQKGKSWLSASVLVPGCAAAWRCTILPVQQATRRGEGWRLASLCNGQHCWLSNQMCWFGRTTGREEWCTGWSVCSTFQWPSDWLHQLEILWTCWMAHEEDVASSYAWPTSSWSYSLRGALRPLPSTPPWRGSPNPSGGWKAVTKAGKHRGSMRIIVIIFVIVIVIITITITITSTTSIITIIIIIIIINSRIISSNIVITNRYIYIYI